MTGANDSSAKTHNNSVDRNENASDELAIVFNVWPAWIARNDGGATPAKKYTKFTIKINKILFFPICESVQKFSFT